MACALSEDSDQPGHSPSLIWVFALCSMDSLGPKLSSCGQRRLWSDWVDAQADLTLRCPGWSESSLGAHATLLVLSWGMHYCFSSNTADPVQHRECMCSKHSGSDYDFPEIQFACRHWYLLQRIDHQFCIILHCDVNTKQTGTQMVCNVHIHVIMDACVDTKFRYETFSVRKVVFIFRGDVSWNNSADSRRADVNFWRKYVH